MSFHTDMNLMTQAKSISATAQTMLKFWRHNWINAVNMNPDCTDAHASPFNDFGVCSVIRLYVCTKPD